MGIKEICEAYVSALESGKRDSILSLFSAEALVESPIYGTMDAVSFYTKLGDDTSQSRLEIRGIFEELDSNRAALYFTYHWRMSSGKEVCFDVVDILSINETHQIEKLTIIYDAEVARRLQSAM
jgi:hypothetical protein